MTARWGRWISHHPYVPASLGALCIGEGSWLITDATKRPLLWVAIAELLVAGIGNLIVAISSARRLPVTVPGPAPERTP